MTARCPPDLPDPGADRDRALPTRLPDMSLDPAEALSAGRHGSTLATFGILVVSVGLAVVAQFTLKAGMNHVGRIGGGDLATPLEAAARVAREPLIWTGLILYGVSAMFWLVVLSRVPLSVAYPFVGMSYLFVVAFSRLILHEQIPALRWAGVVVVAVGIALVGLSFRRLSG